MWSREIWSSWFFYRPSIPSSESGRSHQQRQCGHLTQCNRNWTHNVGLEKFNLVGWLEGGVLGPLGARPSSGVSVQQRPPSWLPVYHKNCLNSPKKIKVREFKADASTKIRPVEYPTPAKNPYKKTHNRFAIQRRSKYQGDIHEINGKVIR